jgi:hypothetical protein
MFQIMLEGDNKPRQEEVDPDKLSKLLEIELMQKRAAWQQMAARGKTLRTVSFFFLFVVILAALIGFYFFFFSGGIPGPRPDSEAPNPRPTPVSSEP